MSYLEREIQYCFDKYPSLFQERWQVLDAIFFGYGAGYYWKKGRIFNCYEEGPGEDYPLKGGAVAKQTIIMEDEKPVGMKFYSGNEYSPINCLPDDIHPDFQKGIDEVRMLKQQEDTFEGAGKSQDWHDQQKDREELAASIRNMPQETKDSILAILKNAMKEIED